LPENEGVVYGSLGEEKKTIKNRIMGEDEIWMKYKVK